MKVNGTLINYYFHCKRQLYYYLYVLKTKGIVRKAGGLWEVQDILCPWEN